MQDQVIQSEGRHLLCPGEVLCGASEWNPLCAIGHRVICKDHALIGESLGKANEFTYGAAHAELYRQHLRPHFHCPTLFETDWLILLRHGRCG